MTIAPFLLLTAELLVLHKGDSSLGFYTPEGRLIKRVALKPHPHEMTMSRDRRWLYITENGTMRIENIAAGGNSMAIVDLKKRKVAKHVDTGKFRRPHGIADYGEVLVTTEAPDQLLRIRDGKIVDTYETKGRISHMVATDPEGTFAYVSNSGSGTVSRIDLSSKAVELIETGKRPEGSAYSRSELVFVCNRESAKISVIDARTGKLAGEIATGKGPVRVAVTPDRSTLVYALIHDRAIGFADVKTRREIATIPVEGMPVSLHLSPDGRTAFAASEEADTVHIVDVAARKLIRSFKTPKGYAPDPVMELLPER